MGAIDGWIKLHRKLLNSSIFQNPNLLKFWVWCLLKATHCDRKTRVGLQEIELKEGQFIFGRNKAGVELGMNPSTIYKYLGVVEKDGLVCTNRNNKFTVVTIVNWSLYQTEEHEKEQQSNSKVTTKEQQSNTNKNVKNDKNDKKEIKPPYPLTEFGFSSRMEESIHLWLKYKKEKKDSYTETGFKTLLGKMKKNIDEYGEQAVISLMDESMSNNWKGIIWSKLESNKKQTGGNPFKEALRKELENEQNGSNGNNDGYQGGLSKLLQEPGRGQ